MRKLLVLALACTAALAMFAPTVSANLLANPGFEAGVLAPWVRPLLAGAGTARFDAYNASYFGPASPYEGVKMMGAAASYSVGKDFAYMYQQVAIPAGDVELRAWGNSWNWNQGVSGAANDTQIRFGLDLTGGTDPTLASIIWSTPVNAISTDFFSSPWQERVVNGVLAADGTVTVFARLRHKVAYEWNVTYVDNFSLIVTPEPSSLLAMGSALAGFAGLMLRKRS